MKRRPLLSLLLSLLVALASSLPCAETVRAGSDLTERLLDLSPRGETRPSTVPALLWTMADDAEFAQAVLARAGAEHRALVDTLLSFVVLTEPIAREQLPDLDFIVDHAPVRPDRAPRWAEVQWQGVKLLRILAPDPTSGRDVRLVRELEAAMDLVTVPKPSAVNGAVLVLRDWWAERGEDPQLTHDPARIPDLGEWMRRLSLLHGDPQVWRAPWMLADLDRDVILRERILARLSADLHAFLAEELTTTLTLLPDSLETLGIARPAWIPRTGSVEGSAALDLWRLSIRMLEVVTGEPVSGADDASRRLAALLWWDNHRHQARYWRDPRMAPSLEPYLRGLEVPEVAGGQNAGTWARSLYIEPSAAELVLERLGPQHRGMVAELVALLPLDRDAAHAAGFVMAVRRRSLIAAPGTGATIVPIAWSDARRFVRRLLGVLTDVEPPPGLEAEQADDFWLAWWEDQRDEAQWSRGGAADAGPR